MGTDKRERQKAARQAKIDQLRHEEERAAGRKRGMRIGIFVVGFLAIAIIASVVLSGDDDGDGDVATDDVPVDDVGTTDDDGSDDPEADDPADPNDTPAIESAVERVPPGDPVEPECPGDDAERTLDFTGSFDDCLTDGVDYLARFDTSEGEVVVDLREDEMRNTVNNFVALARYGYYDETLMFRTDPSIDIIQGGSPHTQDNRDPGPGYTIADEPADGFPGDGTGPFTYEEGQLIMARSAGPDSSSAQYFFSTGPNVSLLDSQGTYLLFGDVIEGLDVLQSIMELHEPGGALGGAPSREVIVFEVEIIEQAADGDGDGDSGDAGGETDSSTIADS